MESEDVALREDALLADQREVYDYWLSLKSRDRLPTRADFKPGRIVRRLPTVSLVEAAFDASRFRFRLAGTGLRETYGTDLTGLYLHEVPLGVQADHWYDIYRHVARTRQPAQGYTPLLWRDRPGVVQAWLRLPFADDHGVVNVILGYDRFLPIERISGRAARGMESRPPVAPLPRFNADASSISAP